MALVLFSLFHVLPSELITQSTNVVEFFLQFFTILAAIKVYKNAANSDRKILIWLVFSTIALFLGDSVYSVFTYIPNINMLVFFIPYLCWIITLIIFLLKILIQNIMKAKPLIITMLFFIVGNTIVISLFFLSKAQYLSDLSGIISGLDLSCFFELILVDLVILCLICAEDIGIQILLSGIPIILSSAFLFNYSYVDQSNTLAAYA
ncbi:MAG: hypothetical protein ACK4PR_14190, partial [Gammaproteobacteria bacterium]